MGWEGGGQGDEGRQVWGDWQSAGAALPAPDAHALAPSHTTTSPHHHLQALLGVDPAEGGVKQRVVCAGESRLVKVVCWRAAGSKGCRTIWRLIVGAARCTIAAAVAASLHSTCAPAGAHTRAALQAPKHHRLASSMEAQPSALLPPVLITKWGGRRSATLPISSATRLWLPAPCRPQSPICTAQREGGKGGWASSGRALRHSTALLCLPAPCRPSCQPICGSSAAGVWQARGGRAVAMRRLRRRRHVGGGEAWSAGTSWGLMARLCCTVCTDAPLRRSPHHLKTQWVGGASSVPAAARIALRARHRHGDQQGNDHHPKGDEAGQAPPLRGPLGGRSGPCGGGHVRREQGSRQHRHRGGGCGSGSGGRAVTPRRLQLGYCA